LTEYGWFKTEAEAHQFAERRSGEKADDSAGSAV
jgi:hypothetical protein